MRLPVDPFIPGILDAFRAHPYLILTATPGAGKTTRLPPALIGLFPGKVIVLEPRRVAAVASALRVADERGWQLGREVGYQVRFDSKVTPQTQLIFMTDALLRRRMVDDPELTDVGLVVIDEFHERNLNQDLVLGALRELREMGRDIKIAVMSATLDSDRLAHFLPGAAVVDVPGEVFPLETRFAGGGEAPRADREFCARIARAIVAADRETNGDILVFLPGVGEMGRVREQLGGQLKRSIVDLHGSLPLDRQRQVLEPSADRRVILATNVAEASLTVPGVNFVIDGGLARQNEMNPRTGFSALQIRRISLFNARQRAGRAARLGPGVSVRMWSEFDEAAMAVEPLPEVVRADLGDALLWLAHLGVRDFAKFAWFNPPPGPLIDWARRALIGLNALDKQNSLTSMGTKLVRLPLEPRLGSLLMRGVQMGVSKTAARLAAILGDRDQVAERDSYANTECDLLLRLEWMREGRLSRSVVQGARQLEEVVSRESTAWSEPGAPSRAKGGDIRAQGGDIRAKGGDIRAKGGDIRAESAAIRAEGAEEDVRILLFETFVDRLCRRRGMAVRARMVGGRGVTLDAGSQVRKSEFFVAINGIDMPGQADTIIRLASGFNKDFVLKHLGDRVYLREDVYFDEAKAHFFARRTRYFEDLALDEPSLTPTSADLVHADFVRRLLDRWEEYVTPHPKLSRWIERTKFLAHHDPRFTEPFGNEEAEINRRSFLELAALGCVSIAEFHAADLVSLAESILPTEYVRSLNQFVPVNFLAPSGVAHPIHYAELFAPYVDVRLQELFGRTETPMIVGGKVPITFRLLGPNYRPVQVTADLTNFWRVGYPEVRRELRARYPKHSWPDDPLTAAAQAKGRPRGR